MSQHTQSEFIRVAEDNWHFETSITREPFTPFGTNYYDPLTWDTVVIWDNPVFVVPQVISQFDPIRTQRHFGQLQDIGVNVIRIFLSAYTFEPVLFTLNEEAFLVVDRIIELAREHDIRIVFDLLDAWEGAPPDSWISWDYFSDETTLKGYEFLVKAFGERYKNEPTIFAWDLINEPFIRWTDGIMDDLWVEWIHKKYGDEHHLAQAWSDYPRSGEHWGRFWVPWHDQNLPNDQWLFDYQLFREDIGYNWTRRLVRTLKEADPNHMVTVGLIQWSVPLAFETNGPAGYAAFNPRKLASEVDYISMHGYNWWDNHRDFYIDGLLRYAFMGKPVMLEEFEYRNQTVDATKGSAAGWLSWAAYQGPNDHNPEHFLFTINEQITNSGKAFRNKASAIKSYLPVRIEDKATLSIDLKALVTDGNHPAQVYRDYMAQRSGLNGPLGFSIINEQQPILLFGNILTTVAEPSFVPKVSLAPNPAYHQIWINYEVPFQDQWVQIDLFLPDGKRIARLVDTRQAPGSYQLHFSLTEAFHQKASGLLICHIRIGEWTCQKKLVVVSD